METHISGGMKSGVVVGNIAVERRSEGEGEKDIKRALSTVMRDQDEDQRGASKPITISSNE